jgi:hypothetical protein
MGFFDKVKTFAGGASTVEIEFTSIERQPPAEAAMPIGDSVIKGNYRITAKKECTVLAHLAELRTRCGDKDGTLGTVRSKDANDENNQVMGAPYQFPYDMKPGDTMDAGFILVNIDVPSYYRAYGVEPKDPSVEVFLKVIVDVKGSPFDPSAEAVVKML